MSLKKLFAKTFTFAALAVSLATANAGVIFQSTPDAKNGFADYRDASSGVAVGRLSVTETQTITQIGVLNYLIGSGTESLKFFIADANTGVFDYLSSAKTFAVDGSAAPALSALTYKLSDLFSFTFQAGTTYAVGYIASGANYSFASFAQTNSANGFTSLLLNENVSNFSNPFLSTSTNCCSIGFELLNTPASNVPEPTTSALLGFGLLSFVASRRRSARRKNV